MLTTLGQTGTWTDVATYGQTDIRTDVELEIRTDGQADAWTHGSNVYTMYLHLAGRTSDGFVIEILTEL